MNIKIGKKVTLSEVQYPRDLRHFTEEQLIARNKLQEEVAIVGMEIGIKAAVITDRIKETIAKITDKKLLALLNENKKAR